MYQEPWGLAFAIWVNQPIHLFLVGCLNPCLQGSSVWVGLPKPCLCYPPLFFNQYNAPRFSITYGRGGVNLIALDWNNMGSSIYTPTWCHHAHQSFAALVGGVIRFHWIYPYLLIINLFVCCYLVGVAKVGGLEPHHQKCCHVILGT